MGEFSGWNLAVLLIAAYVAIVTLVGLMRRRRDEVISDLRDQVDRERKRAAKRKSQSRTSAVPAAPVGKGAVKSES